MKRKITAASMLLFLLLASMPAHALIRIPVPGPVYAVVCVIFAIVLIMMVMGGFMMI